MVDFNTWESSNIDELLSLLVGKEYGPNPREQLEHIMTSKCHEAQNIKKYLNLSSEDRVLDLGSGCGFIANHLAHSVASLQCADISKSFLDYAQRINQLHPNVSYHHIPFADVSSVGSVTAIYSVAVFIHFNLYDCYLYLKQCYNCLESQGRMLFDILNDAHVDVDSPRWQRHSDRYARDRLNIFTNVHYNNPASVLRMAQQIGFDVTQCFDERDHTFILLRRP